jgi:hypothetical protein
MRRQLAKYPGERRSRKRRDAKFCSNACRHLEKKFKRRYSVGIALKGASLKGVA